MEVNYYGKCPDCGAKDRAICQIPDEAKQIPARYVERCAICRRGSVEFKLDGHDPAFAIRMGGSDAE